MEGKPQLPFLSYANANYPDYIIHTSQYWFEEEFKLHPIATHGLIIQIWGLFYLWKTNGKHILIILKPMKKKIAAPITF